MFEFDTPGFATLSRRTQRLKRKHAELEALPGVADMRPAERAIVMATLPASHQRAVKGILDFRREGRRTDPRRPVCDFVPALGAACIVNDAIYGATSQVNPQTSRTWANTVVRSKMGWEGLRARGGRIVEDDFNLVGALNMSSAVAGSIGKWAAYGYSGTRINDANLEGGVVALTPTGSSSLGISLLSSTGTFRFIAPGSSTVAATPDSTMAFECRIAKTTITSAHLAMFVGMMNPTLSSGLPAAAQPIQLTSSPGADVLMTGGDLFGFMLAGTSGNFGGPADISVAYNFVTNHTVIKPANLVSLLSATGQSAMVAATNTAGVGVGFVTLGWVFDKDARVQYVATATANQTVGTLRRPLVRFYVNNELVPQTLTSDDLYQLSTAQTFPSSFMTPVIAVMSQASVGATDAGWADWIYAGQ